MGFLLERGGGSQQEEISVTARLVLSSPFFVRLKTARTMHVLCFYLHSYAMRAMDMIMPYSFTRAL